VLERVVRLADALTGPALAARGTRQREGHDTRQIPRERQLDQLDHLIVDGRELVQVVLVLAVPGRLGTGRASHGPAAAALERGELGCVGFFDLAPAVDESIELVRVLGVHAQRAFGVGDVLEPQVDQALLAEQRCFQRAVVRPGLVRIFAAHEHHPLHQLVVDLPGVLHGLDGVAVLRVAGLALAVRNVALAEADIVGVGVGAGADVQAGER
jgi:hypothetical protein